MRAGFGGGVVIDYPNSTKAKKIFLCLFCGTSPSVLPKGLGQESSVATEISYSKSEARRGVERRKRKLKGSKEWIEAKKERRKRKGRNVRPTSKYSGRRRPRI